MTNMIQAPRTLLECAHHISPSPTILPEKCWRRLPCATEILSSGERRKPQRGIFGSLPPSCPNIAKRWAGFLLEAERPLSHGSSAERKPPLLPGGCGQGILLAPGDCWDAPSHFRLGLAAMTEKFPDALDRLGEFVKSWSAVHVTKA